MGSCIFDGRGCPFFCLGRKDPSCQKAIERLYTYSGKCHEKWHYLHCGRVGGLLPEGRAARSASLRACILRVLQHIGYSILPQAGFSAG